MLLTPAVPEVGELANERVKRSSIAVAGLKPCVLELAIVTSQLIDGYLSVNPHASPTVNQDGP
jgi:hypothetical protein